MSNDEQPNAAFLYARLNDVTVRRMLDQGAGAEAIIGALVADKERYMKRIFELEAIAPRKISMPDGRVVVWQCPVDLLPATHTP